MSFAEVSSASSAVIENLTTLIEGATVVAIYLPIENELDLTAISIDGVTWVSPRVTSRNSMEFADISSPRVEGAFGIEEPTGVAIDNEQIDWLVVPGLAFDRTGHRLGFGAGYYDQWLEKNHHDGRPQVVGVAMEWQIQESIPAESHDVRMGYIVTEQQCIVCNKEEQDG